MSALRIFVINLERDVERRGHMTQVLGALGLAAEFVTAVNGRQLSESDRAAFDRTRSRRIYGVDMTDNEIACYLSHYRLYERMVRERIDVALIMEDDVHVEPVFPRMLTDLLACPFTDWLVVRLDSKRTEIHRPPSAKYDGTRVAALSGGAALYRVRSRVLGTGGYLIRRAGAERMLAYGQRIFMPIDQTMDRYWENGILPYVVRPFPVLQLDDFGSSTGVRPRGRRSAQPLDVRLVRRMQRVIDSVHKRAFNLVH